MNTEPGKTSAEAIFGEALGLPPGDRDPHIVEACGDNDALLAEVRALLAAHEEAPTAFLDSPAEYEATLAADGSGGTSGKPTGKVSFAPPANLTEKEGDMIGPYKLLQQIGEGGFGTVWMAEQSEPISRKVALKVIKAGMDTKEVLSRFEAERQALAMMDHPNIAKVLDAGATESGRPWFSMELVKGIPINRFCDDQKYDTRKRLELFRDVCAAMTHAHQKGIIHRDLKPSNVLVTLHADKPVVKVIDFGIAKAIENKLTDKTLFTRFEQFLGTPVYMSPEQAALSGLDIDTRSDIYGLGVLLYELIAGEPPFDATTLVSAGYDEMRRIIREDDPPRPSLKLHTLTGEDATRITTNHGGTEPQKLERQLKGELDWIVMKAIEKDRVRRYETANALSLDIDRYLEDEPVQAAAPSAAYRFRKFARRNKAAIGTAATIALLLVVGTVGTAWQAVRATRAHSLAQAEAKRALFAEHVATTQKLEARQRAYAADMLLCQEALAENNLREARKLLDRQRPADGEEDLRGWEWRHLWERSRSGALFRVAWYERRVLTALYMDGGNSILTYQDGGRTGLWKLDGRKDEIVLNEGHKRIRSLFSKSGYLCVNADRSLAAGEYATKDGGYAVGFHREDNTKPPAHLPIGENRASSIALSPDGRMLAAFILGSDSARIWDLETQQVVHEEILGPGSENFAILVHGVVVFSPDGKTLAIGGKNGVVRLLDTATWKPKGKDRSINNDVATLAFSPDGKYLASGSQFVDPRVTILDLETENGVRTLYGHNGFVSRVAFSPDGNWLASSSGDQTVKIWNTKTWKESTTLLGHTDEVYSVDWSPDGNRVISGGRDGRVIAWSVAHAIKSRRPAVPYAPGPAPLNISPDGKTYLIIRKGVVQLSSEDTEIPHPELGEHNVFAQWISPEKILVGSNDPPAATIWKPADGSTDSFPLKEGKRLAGHHYCRDSGTLDTIRVQEDRSAIITRWNVTSSREVSSFVVDSWVNVKGQSFSENGRWLAIHEWNSFAVYDLERGKLHALFKVPIGHGVQGVSLSPDGKLIAYSNREAPFIHVLDVNTQTEIALLKGHNLAVARLVFSPDGTRLMSTTIGNEPVKLWDTTSWLEVCRFELQEGHFQWGCDFLYDGSLIGTRDTHFDTDLTSYRVWHAPTLAEIAENEAKNEDLQASPHEQ